MLPRVIILPGNGGCGDGIRESNWYGWMEDELSESQLFREVVLRNMPDPYEAKESIWIPFNDDILKVDENTIVIGHSSGVLKQKHFLKVDGKAMASFNPYTIWAQGLNRQTPTERWIEKAQMT